MSARAAARLETLGFEQVFRYTGGKVDWFAAGLPREGRLASQPRAGDVACRDVPTCRLDERVGDVAQKTGEIGWSVCVVLHDDRVVLGLLDATAIGADPTALAQNVMRSAPLTIRPHLTLEQAAQRLDRSKTDHALVTDADGRLIGWLQRRDLERRLADASSHAVSS